MTTAGDVAAYAAFCRKLGYRVVGGERGVWIGRGSRVFQRLPPCLDDEPPPTERRELLRRQRALGILYVTPPSPAGAPASVYTVRNKNYDLAALDRRGRWSVRQGLTHCTVRRIAFEELQQQGRSLNRDTLDRHGRQEPMFESASGWERFCAAGLRQRVDAASRTGRMLNALDMVRAAAGGRRERHP